MQNCEFVYEPVDDEAAQLVGALAAKAAGVRICSCLRECHRDCMLILGAPPDQAIDAAGDNISIFVTLWCDKGEGYFLDCNRAYHDGSSSPRPLLIPMSFVRPAGDYESRIRRMYLQRRKNAYGKTPDRNILHS